MIVTNNDKVFQMYKDDYSIYYKECNFREILLYIRDRIHEGHVLLTHPLSSSIKPNETPYKSVIISDYKKSLDYKSLMIIENAIMTYDKFKKDKDYTVELTERIIDDFKMVDLSIMRNAIS